MNNTFDVSLSHPLDSSKDSKLINPKRSFAFFQDFNIVLTSLGSNQTYMLQWHANRKKLYSTHLSIIEAVYQKVSKESDVSIQKTEIMIEYLRGKSVQIHKYASAIQKYIVSRKQSIDNSVEVRSQFDPFSDVWGNMDHIHLNIQKQAQNFASIIDQTLLKSLLLEEQRNYISIVSKYKSRISVAKKRLDKLDQETESRFSAYSRAYEEVVKDIRDNKKLRSRKSLYLYEHEFLSVALDHEKVFQEFAVTMIDFFREFWRLEEAKTEKIKNTLRRYFEDFKAIFKRENEMKTLEGLVDDIDHNKRWKESFQLKNVLTEEQIAKSIQNPEGTPRDLEGFLLGFKLEEILESELILGKFTCMRQLNRNKNKDNDSWIDGMAIITKDSWLLLINDVKDMYRDPDYLIDLSRCSFKERGEEMVIALNEKNKGWCKKDSIHWIKLDSNKDMLDFLELLRGGKF